MNNSFSFLLSMKKEFDNPTNIEIPLSGQSKRYKLSGQPYGFIFYVDFDRQGEIEDKMKLQLRYNNNPLVRLEINSRRHINPDGLFVSNNHVHIFMGNDGKNWAYELNSVFDSDIIGMSYAGRFSHFCNYCNISLTNVILQEVL